MSQKSVLVANADHELAALLASNFHRLGMSVRVAHDGTTALQAVLQCLPDLLCLDGSLEAGGGMTVGEVLARDQDASRVPAIVLVASGHNEVARRCRPLCAYYLSPAGNLWRRVEPVVEELVDLSPQTLPQGTGQAGDGPG